MHNKTQSFVKESRQQPIIELFCEHPENRLLFFGADL